MPETHDPRPEPQKRVRVTSPRMGTPRRGQSRPMPPVAAEIDAQTSLGELHIASLIRAQWRLSVSVLALAAVLIGGLPLLFLFVPSTRTVSIGPIPLPWLILGVLIYPAVWVTARYYVRQSAQIEREFTELDAQR